LLLIPVKKKDSPHRVADLEGEEGTRSSRLANAHGLPRVMSPLVGGGRCCKEEVVAEGRLLAWKRHDRANPCASGPCFEASSGKSLLRCSGIVSCRLTESAEGRERWGEGGEAEATQSMETSKEAVAALLKKKVALPGNEEPMVGSISTVDMVEEIISERQEVVPGPMKDEGESLAYGGLGGGDTDEVRGFDLFRVRGPNATAMT
jgi:hypothetical protein